jgi:ABC-2 type transport system ATP-binding protein
MINIIGLKKYYGSVKAIDDISFNVERGQVIGVAGENGAGKTTLFRCVAGLENYKGQILSDINPLKNHLGYLPSELYFFPKITAMEYIRLLCNARGKEPKNIEEKNIFDLPLNRYASTFSTGMQKKLAITAILQQENSLFVLDEPFNGIDIQSNMILTEIIIKLKSLNKTCIISSHIFSTLSETCDEIILLKQGHLIKSAKKESFAALESEMKDFLIGDKIERLGL